MSSDRLQQLSKTFTPTLNEEGRIEQTILNGAAGRPSIEQIAGEVAAQFPHRFAAWTDAQSAGCVRCRGYSMVWLGLGADPADLAILWSGALVILPAPRVPTARGGRRGDRGGCASRSGWLGAAVRPPSTRLR